MEWITVLWIAAIIIFAVIEAATVGLVSIWFAVGGVFALITSVIVPSLYIQAAVFIIMSAVAFFVTKPLVRKFRTNKHVAVNADLNIGRTARVIEPISPFSPGRVRLDGVDWRATSEVSLAVDDLCRVVAVNSASLAVAPVEDGTI